MTPPTPEEALERLEAFARYLRRGAILDFSFTDEKARRYSSDLTSVLTELRALRSRQAEGWEMAFEAWWEANGDFAPMFREVFRAGFEARPAVGWPVDDREEWVIDEGVLADAHEASGLPRGTIRASIRAYLDAQFDPPAEPVEGEKWWLG